VVQYVYDSHYEAAKEAQRSPALWAALKGRVDQTRFDSVLEQLTYQAGHAMVWRDAICTWFARESGIPDTQRRVGHNPDRREAEEMQLDGYALQDVTPAEDASNGKGVICTRPPCSAAFVFQGAPGRYEIAVQYFDLPGGNAHLRSSVNEREIASWYAHDNLPSKILNGDTSTRRTIPNVKLKPGDRIRIEGTPDGPDSAGLDYVSVSLAPEHARSR
jgi:alpha-glucuronidase